MAMVFLRFANTAIRTLAANKIRPPPRTEDVRADAREGGGGGVGEGVLVTSVDSSERLPVGKTTPDAKNRLKALLDMIGQKVERMPSPTPAVIGYAPGGVFLNNYFFANLKNRASKSEYFANLKSRFPLQYHLNEILVFDPPLV